MKNLPQQFYLAINRELRCVPLDWRHPLDEHGQPIPLSPEEMPDISALPDDRLGLCVYETTSEGTPCSPIFENSPAGREALLDYCTERVSVFANHMATRERWEELLFDGKQLTLEMRRAMPVVDRRARS